MPVYLRRFYLKKLIELKEEEKQQIDKVSNKTKNIPKMPSISKSKFNR